MGAAEELIGRQAEISAVGEFLEGAEAGARCLVLDGEAGIGKTALWQAGVGLARSRGARVLACRPAGVEVKLSFAALGDLLTGVLGDALPALPPPQRRALEVALLVAEPGGQPPDERAIAVAFLSVVRRLAANGPLLVAVDDAQWLDGPSAVVLAFALRRLEAEPVRVLATVRRGAGERALEESFAPLSVERTQVGPLSLGAVHELLGTRLGVRFSRPTVVRVHEISGGNPFFALELGRALAARGREPAHDEPLPVPEGMRPLVRERLAGLPAPARETLLTVAALARPTVAIVRAAAEDPEQAAVDLRQASEAEVIECEGERIRFTHPLLASTHYAQAPQWQRRRVHRRLAAVSTDPEERAGHLARAARPPDPAVAAKLEEAAAAACARGAPSAAALLCEDARRLTAADRDAEIRRRTTAAADYHLLAGDTSRARQLLESALRSAAPPAPRERARLLQRLGEVHYHEDSWATAEDCFTDALAEADDEASLRCEIEQALAFARQVRGDIPAAARHAQAAVRLAEQAADSRLLCESLTLFAVQEFFLGRGIRTDLMQRAAALDAGAARERPGLRSQLLNRSLMSGAMLKWVGDFDAARPLFAALYRQARERGDEGSLPFLLHHLSELECWAGDWPLAARHAAEGAKIAVLAGQSTMVGATRYAQALVEAHLGHTESARTYAEDALAVARRSANVAVMLMSQSVLGFLALSLGDPAGAHGYLGPLADGLAAVGLKEPAVVRFLPDEIEALVAVGEHEQAREFADALEERGAALDRPWALATAARCHGLLLAAGGDLPAAEAAVAGALAHHQRVAQPFERARTVLTRGTIQRQAGQKRAARQTLEEALEAFQRLGARLWADKTRAELRRIGGRVAPQSGLTETEQRIVTLVRAGQSNNEVARSLSLSTKTVAWNLTKVYRKLGVHSRTQLAALPTADSRINARATR